MRQLECIQILYAFHFDSLPKNEQNTSTVITTFLGILETSK